jgi:hypothetical protein
MEPGTKTPKTHRPARRGGLPEYCGGLSNRSARASLWEAQAMLYDREKAKANAALDTLTVLARLRAGIPAAWERAEVVGRWVWVAFDGPPPAEVRAALLELGFHWNHKRRCWQHACGFWSTRSVGDPRFRYGRVRAADVALEADAETLAEPVLA